MNDCPRIDNGLWWMNGFAIESTHVCNFRDYRLIQITVNTKPVVKCFSPIQQFLEFRIKFGDRKRLISTKVLLRALYAGATPIPDLSFRVAGADKQGILIGFYYSD